MKTVYRLFELMDGGLLRHATGYYEDDSDNFRGLDEDFDSIDEAREAIKKADRSSKWDLLVMAVIIEEEEYLNDNARDDSKYDWSDEFDYER